MDRKFATFAATSTKNLVNSLHHLFSFTLLAAESFFHTLAVSTEFCPQVINSNLKIINWKKNRDGFQCQHQDVVDWCGSSLSILRTEGWYGICRPAAEIRSSYFARKFDPIINQKVVSLAEEQSYKEEIEKGESFDAY